MSSEPSARLRPDPFGEDSALVDRPEDLIGERNYLHLVFIAVGALVADGVLIWRSFSPVPAFADLKVFEATLGGVDRTDQPWLQSGLYRLRFIERQRVYRYPENYPRSRTVAGPPIGEKLRVTSDVGESYTIFQVERQGERLASYEEVADFLYRGKRRDLLVFAPLLIVLSGAMFWLLHRLYHLRLTQVPTQARTSH